MSEPHLLIPGPTPLPPEVLAAMARPMVNHRGEDFGRTLAEVLRGLQQIFQTSSPVLPFVASGTGGLEAAIVNLLSPGDRVLALIGGLFGERFAAVAREYGLEVLRQEVEWGRAIDPEQVAEALRGHADVKAVLLTHNETSTGVANDVQAIAEIVRESDALLLVDAISSIGALDLQTDAWGVDVVIAGSQKALMGPPGAVFVSVGPRAWEAVEQSRLPKLYFSFARMRQELEQEKAFTPFTPAIPVIYALRVSVKMILDEGLPARFARHARLGRAAREGIQALGLRLFPDPRWASNAVTAVRIPDGVEAATLLRTLRTEHGIVLAGGVGQLVGKIFRLGHMGYVQGEQILAALRALEAVLPATVIPTRGRAASAAERVLSAT